MFADRAPRKMPVRCPQSLAIRTPRLVRVRKTDARSRTGGPAWETSVLAQRAALKGPRWTRAREDSPRPSFCSQARRWARLLAGGSFTPGANRVKVGARCGVILLKEQETACC